MCSIHAGEAISKHTGVAHPLNHAGLSPAALVCFLMAKSFSNIKKSLGLLDIIQFGKYKGCRVDSIIEQDDEYLRYMQTHGIKFDADVMSALTNKFLATSNIVNAEDDASYFSGNTYDIIIFDEIPF